MAEQEEHAAHMQDSLRRMYQDDDDFLSDVCLLVGDQKILAHKIVLAIHSDFFKFLFRNEETKEVKIEVCSYHTLTTIIHYFYTGKPELTLDNVQDVLVASNFLQVKELITKCSDLMARNLDVTNCVTVLRLADLLNNDVLLQEAINFIGDKFHTLLTSSTIDDMMMLPVDLFAKCIKSDRIILFSQYGTVLPAIQREEALVRVIVKYVRHCEQEKRIKDTWPLFRSLKLPYIAHHLDFRKSGLPELANFDDDPTVHSLIRSSRVEKEDDLRRKYSVDPFSKHNSTLRAFSIMYVLWTEKFGCGPNSSYREVRPFCCEGGTDKFITSIKLYFRTWEAKQILGGLKVCWSNGSTDVAGLTELHTEQQQLPQQQSQQLPHQQQQPPSVEQQQMMDMVHLQGGLQQMDLQLPAGGLQTYSVDLEEGENIQKFDICSGWLIDRVTISTNKGRTFGPFGGEGGEARRTQRLLRRIVDLRYVYLDGIRGYVVHTEGMPALNRLSLKWAFFLDRKVSKYSYYNSVVIKEEEKISVAELESETNLTLSTINMIRSGVRSTRATRLTPAVGMDYIDIDDEDGEVVYSTHQGLRSSLDTMDDLDLHMAFDFGPY